MRHWPYRGVPDNPGAWLMRAARNRALDLLRREGTARDKGENLARAALVAAETEIPPEVLDSALRDDGLRLMVACCHPALPREVRIALTLKALCGFGVPEIARAFLLPEPAIAQRLARAKRTLRRLDLRLHPPDAAALPERLDAVLDVLYLLFNEGYAAHAGDDLVRHDLCAEAIRLVTLLAEHPAADRPAVHALRALMLLQAARLPARTDARGAIVLLEDQDRSRWDRRLIALGLHALARAARGATLAMVAGPAAGLAALGDVRDRHGMAAYHLLHAVEGSFHARLGDHPRAAAAYRRALSLAATTPERHFLAAKIVQCEMSAPN